MKNDFPAEFFAFDTLRDKKIKKRGYLPSPLIIASLPMKNVNKQTFTRKFNNIEFSITSTNNVPYGSYARLLLTILTTKAVISKEENVVIEYSSISALTKDLLLPRQRCNAIKEQLELFSTSNFIFKELQSRKIDKNIVNELHSRGKVTATWHSIGNIPFMRNLQWIDLKGVSKDNDKTIGIHIDLSDDFVKMCKKHAVPIDYSVYSSIDSIITKDLYVWLVYRNNSLKANEEIEIYKDSLIDQFQTNEDMTPKQKSNLYSMTIVPAIKNIKQYYYKDLNISFCNNNNTIRIRKSPSVIAQKDKKYMLITSDL